MSSSFNSNQAHVDSKPPPDGSGRIDHLVYACSDLQAGMARITELLGVAPVVGGHHPNWGTHNALVGLGATCYLEVIAPSPIDNSDEVRTPDVFHESGSGRLTTWAACVENLEAFANAHAGGHPPLGALISGSRKRADGLMLSWTLTDPASCLFGGAVPFLIDWGDSEHPARSLDSTCFLRWLRVAHPRPDSVESSLGALGLRDLVQVCEAPQPSLSAVIETPGGLVEI